MTRHIDWPDEDIVMEISWNGNPDDCSLVLREFLPDPCCAFCMKHKKEGCVVPDGDVEDVCGEYEWDENLDNLREDPRKPKREDYRTKEAFYKAVDAVSKWWYLYGPDE